MKEENEKQLCNIHSDICTICSICSAEKSEASGLKWNVRIVKAGLDKNGYYYPIEVLANSVGIYEGAEVFALKDSQHRKTSEYGKSTEELVGWLRDVKSDAEGLIGTLELLETAEKVRKDLLDSFSRGKNDLLGLSHDIQAFVEEREDLVYVTEIISATVDIVYRPAAGGEFLSIAAAEKIKKENINLEENNTMEKIEEKVEQLSQTVEALVAALAKKEETKPEVKEDTSIKVALQALLAAELVNSDLPEAVKTKVEKSFADREFTALDVKSAITAEKDMMEKLESDGVVAVRGSLKQETSEVDNGIEMLRDVIQGNAHSIKAAYVKITGDVNVTGRLQNTQGIKAALTTSNWTNALADEMHKQLLEEYNMSGLDNWKKIVSIGSAPDFRNMKFSAIGGYADLDDVSENGAYTAISSPTDQKVQMAVSKKGNTESVTLEMVKNDDVDAIRLIPVKLGRSGAKTLNHFVFRTLLEGNPDFDVDSTAIFHADHGNIDVAASNALTQSRIEDGWLAMMSQTDIGDNEKIGIGPRYLVVPTPLAKTGFNLVAMPASGKFIPTSDAEQFMKQMGLELIVAKTLTDVNNWYLIADPKDIPTMKIIFLDGKQEPELWTQDMPNVGSMFTNDRITLKIRHIYGGNWLDYRGAYAGIVPAGY